MTNANDVPVSAKQLGDMTEDEKAAAIAWALRQFQRELDATSEAIGAILSEGIEEQA